MDNIIFLIGFCSIYTKVLAVDLDRGEVLGRAQSPITVQENTSLLRLNGGTDGGDK